MDISEYRKIEFEQREKRLKNAVFQKLEKNNDIKDKLDIVYVMTWTSVCGGSKIILEHANYLVDRGHKITIISHFPKPDWFNMDNRIKFIMVPWKDVLCEVIHDCDLIVATYWREIYECIEQKKAPVVYFEQGDNHLFDVDSLDERTFKYIQKQFEVVPFIFTVSSYAAEKIKEIYKRDSNIIPNAVNEKCFYKKSTVKEVNDEMNIAIIGSENSDFKGIKNILEAVQILRNEGYPIKLNWVTPDKPTVSKEACLINPPQSEIGNMLRASDVYICASKYESFGLPILEAMKCGLPIITTDTGGNRDFIKEYKNALLITGQPEDIANKVKILINDKDMLEEFAKNSLIMSEKYTWKNVIDRLEEYYRTLAKYKVASEEENVK